MCQLLCSKCLLHWERKSSVDTSPHLCLRLQDQEGSKETIVERMALSCCEQAKAAASHAEFGNDGCKCHRGHLGRLINKLATSSSYLRLHTLSSQIMIPNLTHNLLSLFYLFVYYSITLEEKIIYPSAQCSTTTSKLDGENSSKQARAYPGIIGCLS